VQDFTSAGAVVAVDASTGNYTIVGKFLWPKGVRTRRSEAWRDRS